jgi:CubicO group peptidase (beta-lactamase class C family)
MNRTSRWLTLVLLVWMLGIPLLVSAGTIPQAKPEEVGLSSERLQRIHEMVQRYIADNRFSGAVTLVARKGRIAHFEAQGLMDLDAKKAMSKDGIFRIMSMTKTVVGASVLILIEEGKIRLDDPISKFIPQFKDLKVAVLMPDPPASFGAPQASTEPRYYTIPADREITVRDLLTHTSGLVSGPVSEKQKAQISRKNAVLAEYIPKLGAIPLEFQSGTKWAYSAEGAFDTLARVVEIVSGLRFDQFTRVRLFDPLGMKDTFFNIPQGVESRIVTLYRKTPKGLQHQDEMDFANSTYLSGGGGLYSTAEDFLQFGQMLANGGKLNGKQLLGSRTVEMMRSIFVPDTLPGRSKGEGFGLSVRVVSDSAAAGTMLSNGSFGWSGAFGTHFWVDPKTNVVAILMVQTMAADFEPIKDFETAVMQAIID